MGKMDSNTSGESSLYTLPTQNPEVPFNLCAAGQILCSHAQQLVHLTNTLEELLHVVRNVQVPAPLSAQAPPPAPVSLQPPVQLSPSPSDTSLPSVKLALPDKYNGSSGLCKGFLMQCSIYFSRAMLLFPLIH